VETPRAWPSDKAEESYLLVEGDYRRVATVVPAREAAEAVKNSPEPPSAGERDGGEEKGPEREELRFFRTVPPGKMERIITQLYGPRRWEWSGFASKAGGTGDPQPSGEERADLTELSERSFRAGISSGGKSS
jgi:hypothetical protein